MTTDEIMKKIREGLTGEYSVDMVYLESQADKYRSAKNAKEIGSAIADLAYEILCGAAAGKDGVFHVRTDRNAGAAAGPAGRSAVFAAGNRPL